MISQSISKQTLQRLPIYLSYLKSLPVEKYENISASIIASALNLNQILVRKDLAFVSSIGKPKIGHDKKSLIDALEKFLGYDQLNDAVLVGAGKLGRALLSYEGFSDYGLNILAGFDIDLNIIGKKENGKPILEMSKFKNLTNRLKIQIGIITVPSKEAQNICDQMILCGIKAIWNFAPIHIIAPDDILIQNENIASSLAILSNHLKEKLKK